MKIDDLVKIIKIADKVDQKGQRKIAVELDNIVNSILKTSKCECDPNTLQPFGTFQGRVMYYCYKCEEEVLEQPWSSQTPYPQDNGLPSRQIMDGSN